MKRYLCRLQGTLFMRSPFLGMRPPCHWAQAGGKPWSQAVGGTGVPDCRLATHPCCMRYPLSSGPWDPLFRLPFPLTGIRQHQSWKGPEQLSSPFACSWRRRPGGGRGLCLATWPAGAELELEPKASGPARGFPALRLSLAHYLILFHLVSSLRIRGWRGSTEMRSSNRLEHTWLGQCTVT